MLGQYMVLMLGVDFGRNQTLIDMDDRRLRISNSNATVDWSRRRRETIASYHGPSFVPLRLTGVPRPVINHTKLRRGKRWGGTRYVQEITKLLHYLRVVYKSGCNILTYGQCQIGEDVYQLPSTSLIWTCFIFFAAITPTSAEKLPRKHG